MGSNKPGGRGGAYSPLQKVQKFARYYLSAANGKGHGIHSPFVYDFVRHVLNDRSVAPAYAAVESLRRQLKKDPTVLEIEDMGAAGGMDGGGGSGTGGGLVQGMGAGGGFGAGSGQGAIRRRRITDITAQDAKSPKWGQLLFRIARHYRPATVLELGTSMGLSAAYLASGSPQATVWTLEGAEAVAGVAVNNFRSLGLDTIKSVTGNFDQVLASVLEKAGPIGLAYVDGNHRKEPTLRYFESLLGHLSPSSALIFDDIYWSREMEEAWDTIKRDRRVYLTIDLFSIGIVFFREEFKVKQDFKIRF